MLLIAGLVGCNPKEKPVPPLPPKRAALVDDSAALFRPELPGVTLEMDLSELLRVHSHLMRQPAADREQLKVYEEQLGDQRRALYFFGGPAQRLLRVQVASQLPHVDAIVQRVLDVQQRLGAPTGVYDCPAASGQVPTRRYSYLRGAAGALDVYAILGERALATYYVASANQLRDSLKLAGCLPISPARAARFPAVPPP